MRQFEQDIDILHQEEQEEVRYCYYKGSQVNEIVGKDFFFELNKVIVTPTIDHGRSEKLGCWVEFKQIARFKKLKDFCRISQYGLAFLV